MLYSKVQRAMEHIWALSAAWFLAQGFEVRHGGFEVEPVRNASEPCALRKAGTVRCNACHGVTFFCFSIVFLAC